MPWVVDKLRRGEMVRIADPDEFPEEARIDRDTFLTLGLKATVLVPITRRWFSVLCPLCGLFIYKDRFAPMR